MKKFLLMATMMLTFGFVNAQINIRKGSSSYGDVYIIGMEQTFVKDQVLMVM